MNNQNQSPSTAVRSSADIEQGCIDLIARMEASVSSARESTPGAHLENSAETCDKLLNSLLDFSEDFLHGSEAEEVKTVILSAAYAKSAHREVLDNRPWSSAIKGIFGGADKDENVRETHEQLKKNLMHACAITLQKAVTVVGADSETGKMIVQSSEVLIDEFAQYW